MARLLLYLSFFLLLLLRPSFEQLQPPSLSPDEIAALLDIRKSLRDIHGSNFFTTWDFNADPCTSFAGVICSSDDDQQGHLLRVSVLTLGTGLADSPGLTGTLTPSIANLTALTELVVYPGRITGPIPTYLGYRLRLISISNNLISGPIPSSLAGLPDLHTLDLGHNQLSGSIPPPLFSSTPSLKVLILASNGNLSGDLPQDISTSQLLHLDLRQNSFTGRLPPLPSTLRYLSVSANSISGSLDASFTTPLPDLTFLDLSMNTFSGQIPPAIFAFPHLSSILLHRNNLSGPLTLPPANSSSAGPSWAVVDLSHNMLSGEVPAGLAGAKSLFLNNNRLTGTVPEEYAKSVYGGNMSTLYIQHNFLTGFPAPSLPLPESVSLCLSYNCMVPPPSTAVGCPVSAGTQLSRPIYQCLNATTSTGGG